MLRRYQPNLKDLGKIVQGAPQLTDDGYLNDSRGCQRGATQKNEASIFEKLLADYKPPQTKSPTSNNYNGAGNYSDYCAGAEAFIF